MIATVYIVGARRQLAGKMHEFGREIRLLVFPDGKPRYESRMVVTAPDGSRYVGAWDRMEREP